MSATFNPDIDTIEDYDDPEDAEVEDGDFADALAELLQVASDDEGGIDFGDAYRQVTRVESFEDVGMLTHDTGIVVTLDDGSEFQVTIVRSR